MRDSAAQEHRMQRVGRHDVVNEPPMPAQQPAILNAGDRLAAYRRWKRWRLASGCGPSGGRLASDSRPLPACQSSCHTVRTSDKVSKRKFGCGRPGELKVKAAEKDPRVKHAAAHWGPRLTVNGVAYSDFVDVTSSIEPLGRVVRRLARRAPRSMRTWAARLSTRASSSAPAST